MERIPVPANHVVHYALEKADVDTALGFAESRLSGDPTDAELLATYVEVAKQHDGDERAEEFLAGGLWKLPISIPWHRTYGWLNESGEQEKRLAAEYDAHLEESPDDAEAAAWRERACAKLDEQSANMQRIAAILRGPSEPTQEQLDAVTTWPHTKAIVLASLIIQFPDEKIWLAEQARLLNVSHQPPYLLVQQAIEWEP